MKKRIFGLLLALIFMLMPVLSLAENATEAAGEAATEAAPAAAFDYESIKTPHIIVIDAGDTEAANPIYERAADEQLFPASTTKILTAIVALENKSPEDEITVGSEIRGMFELKNGYTTASSLMGLVEGETVTLNDLLHGLLLVSGNEAADAIAVGVAGSIESFVELMNAKAQELGMTNSHFANPNGVHDKKHYSTARDMAKLTAYALNNAKFAEIVATAKYEVPANSVRNYPLILTNSNFLITAEGNPDHADLVYENAIGVKTGLTTKSGSCLVAAGESNGAKAIVCLYEDDVDDKYDRFTNAKAILQNLFENVYTTVTGEDLQLQTHFTCKIENAREEDLNANGELEMDTDVSGLQIRTLPEKADALKNNSGAIKAEVTWESSLSAPVHQGQLLGTVNYIYDGRTIYSSELTAPSDVLEVPLVSSEVVTADTGDSVTAGLLATPEPSGIKAKAGTESGGFSSFLKIILIAVGAIIVLAALFIAVMLIRKSIRKKRRRELLRRKRLAEQRARRDAARSYPAEEDERPARSTSAHSTAPRGNTAVHRPSSGERTSRK